MVARTLKERDYLGNVLALWQDHRGYTVLLNGVLLSEIDTFWLALVEFERRARELLRRIA